MYLNNNKNLDSQQTQRIIKPTNSLLSKESRGGNQPIILNKIQLLYQILIAAFITFSCAHKVAPNGGAKDEKAPQISVSNPLQGATNVQNKSISITFDEYVQLNNPETELVISPYIAERPKVKLKAKTLLVEFEKPLQENTTYTFNFGNSIKDLTEANTIKDYTFYFSTGSILDSLQVKGEVLSADRKTPLENILVLLYDSNAPDSAFRTTPPQYIARTNKEGKFSINNLPNKAFQLFALKDQNTNYYYDQTNEDIAFSDSSTLKAMPRSSSVSHRLLLFNEQLAPPTLQQKTNTEYSRILLQYSRSLDSLQVQLLDTALIKNTLIETMPQRDSIYLWYKNIKSDDPIRLVVNGAGLHDTIEYVRTIDSRNTQGIAFTSSINLGRGSSTLDLGKTVWLEFNHPIMEWNTDSVRLIADDVAVKVPKDWIQKDSQRSRRYHLKQNAWKADVDYQIIIPEATMTDFQGNKNKEISIKFSTASPQKYGTLTLQLQNMQPTTPYLLKVYRNVNNELIKQQTITAANTEILYFTPDTYTMVLTEDTNKNGKWDTGNLAKKQQSERVFAPKQATTLKALWNTDVIIDVK